MIAIKKLYLQINSNKKFSILLISSIILLVLWSFAIPIFECPDENLHWQYANHLHNTKTLPIFSKGFGEANSPPLYYILVAPFASDSQVPDLYKNNFGIGPIVSSDGIIHPIGTQTFKHTNSDFKKYWLIRFTRLVSVLFSIITVIFCYLLGKEATGNISTGIITASIIAFLPQFTFRCTQVSNDALLTTFCSISTYLFIRLYKREFSWNIAILSSLIISAAFLTKITAIILPIPFILVLLCKKNNLKTNLIRILILNSIILLIIAPWITRNILLYGDVFATNAMRFYVPSIIKIKTITSPYFWNVFPSLFLKSFIGVFGWMNIFLPTWIYNSYYIFAILSLSGLIYSIIKKKHDKILLFILILFPILSFIIIIRINLMFNQPQGRYFFSALPAISLLLCLGIEALPFMSENILKYVTRFLYLLNAFILITVVIPTYWPVI